MSDPGGVVTAADVLAVSRYRASGVQAVLKLGEWQLTRSMLLIRRMSPAAWVTRKGEQVELTAEAAAEIAESLNAVRPWKVGV